MVEVVNNELILLVISVASSVLGIVCLGLILIVNSNLKKQHDRQVQQSKALKASEHQVSILRSELAELRSAIMNLGKKVSSNQQSIAELANQQAEQKYDDPDAKIYSRAVKMVELGADIEEIMRECELPRAEAELLMSLHNKT
ncbi:DUF2802 domain-containing protein [Pseudoalteromonas sp. T1lg65]|uniref:DUF2802 domain-containing protein n=1 Tax=Pseudoalteromonas sp. T1lg65 TaxID=2077101 RepID=UPI003F79FE49